MNLLDHPLTRATRAALRHSSGDLIVGVSGGADSVALLRALALRRGERRILVAHLDHALRPQSGEEADWVRKLAGSLDLPVIIERQDVTGAASEAGIGLEEAARRCRYEFLARRAAERDCRSVLVAHTADDQAETVLHQLLRGTGLSGLRGMPASRPLQAATLLRPLLSVTRADVLDFLERIDQPFLTDPSNAEPAFTRNRIRHELLPLLEEQFNPQVASALRRLSQQAGDVTELIDELADDLLASAVTEAGPDRVRLDVDPLRTVHRHLVREAFRLLFARQDWPRRRMGFDAWDHLADLAQTSRVPKSLTLPEGMRAHYRQGIVTLERS